MSSFGNSFVQAFNPAFRQSQNDYSEQVRQSLLNQQRIDEERRQRAQPYLDYADKNGIPVPADYMTNPTAWTDFAGKVGSHMRTQGVLDAASKASAETNARVAAQQKLEGYDPASGTPYAEWKNQVGNAEKAKAARDQIKALQGEFSGKFDNYDPSKMADTEVLGVLPQIQGQAASFRRISEQEAKDSMLEKNLKQEYANRGGDPNSTDGKAWIADKLEVNRLPAHMQLAHYQAQDMQLQGLIPNDRRSFEKERARLTQFGGTPPKLTTSQENALVGDQNLIRNLSTVQSRINDFESKYGPGSFDQYVGPIDSKTLQLSLNTGIGDTPQSRDAGRIIQNWQDALNTKIRDVSGAQTSAQEIARNLLASGNLSSANFKNALQGWRETAINGYSNRLKAVDGFAVPDSFKTFDPNSLIKTNTPAAQADSAKPITVGKYTITVQ